MLLAGVATSISADARASSIKQSETLTNVSADFRASTIQLSTDNRAINTQLSTDNRANTAEFCATFRDMQANNLEYQKCVLDKFDKILTNQVKRSRRYDDDDGDSDNEDDGDLKPAARKKQKR